jgi:hypothetical protein
MQNVARRYDAIPIGPKKLSSKTEKSPDAQLETIVEEETSQRKSTRQDDTPPLGSLGGRLPRSQSTHKVKPRKIKRRQAPPGTLKIYDSQGREVSRPWKRVLETPAIE